MKYFFSILILVFPFFLKAQIGIGKKQVELLFLKKGTATTQNNYKIVGKNNSNNEIMPAPKYKEAFFCTIENRIAKRRKLGFDFGVE